MPSSESISGAANVGRSPDRTSASIALECATNPFLTAPDLAVDVDARRVDLHARDRLDDLGRLDQEPLADVGRRHVGRPSDFEVVAGVVSEGGPDEPFEGRRIGCRRAGAGTPAPLRRPRP